jgi:hypothetical protein
MSRAWALLAAAPLGVTAPGTVQGDVVVQKVQQGPVPVCMVHGTIDPNGARFDNLGPAIALYRRDVAGGQVALTLPRVAHGTLTTNGNSTVAAYDYISLGEASLDFTTPTTGTVTFIGGGNVLANPNTAPTFRFYRETWKKTTKELEVHVIFDMGGCALPVISYFQF